LDGPSLLAYPTNRSAYSLLCNLLSKGNLRAEKGKCFLYKADVYEYSKDVKFIVITPNVLNEIFDFEDSFKEVLQEYTNSFGENFYISAS
jgi:error-prone DNA polymerase